MSTTDVARATAWLDRLAQAHEAATPGPWKHYNPTDGQTWWYPRDAAAIVAEHNNFAALLALARGVAALAEELETTASSRRVLALDAEAAGASEESVFLRDRADDEQAQADRLRALLAVAAPDEETR